MSLERTWQCPKCVSLLDLGIFLQKEYSKMVEDGKYTHLLQKHSRLYVNLVYCLGCESGRFD